MPGDETTETTIPFDRELLEGPAFLRRRFRSIGQALSTANGTPATDFTNYRVSVSLNGFQCHTQSWDTMFESDGAGDDIYVVAECVRSKTDKTIVDQWSKRCSHVYGQSQALAGTILLTLPGRYVSGPLSGDPTRQYGTAHFSGGIRSGDSVPSPQPWGRFDTNVMKPQLYKDRLPMTLFEREGKITDKSDEILTVAPVLYEWDGGSQLEGLFSTVADIAKVVVPIVTTSFGGPVWLGSLAAAAPEAVKNIVNVTGRPGDREIGLKDAGDGKFKFEPLALSIKLNPADLAMAAATANPRGYGPGIFNFYFKDPTSLGDGAYTAFLEVRFETWPEMM